MQPDFRELAFLSGKQTAVREVNGSMPKTISENNRSCKQTAGNVTAVTCAGGGPGLSSWKRTVFG